MASELHCSWPIMLKITTVETPGECLLVVSGKVAEPWLPELKKAWESARSSLGNGRLVLDLRDVTTISSEGEAALMQMMNEGAQFLCRGVLVTHVMEKLAGKCKAENDCTRRTH